ncbi:MAG TPA: DegQ family serine endoprotease [Terrimicrobiaceae bacterium]|nr:DegQ family serine endoprotease [Terrimicrobiaceae bacterium]
MSRHLMVLLLSMALLSWTSASATAQATGNEPPTLAPILEKVLPGVVSVAVRGHKKAEENPLLADPFFRQFFGLPEGQQPKEREFHAAGSGVVLEAARGYILTNAHVIENAEEVTVTLSDGQQMDAKKVGTDLATDVAVIQVKTSGLFSMPLGDSDKLRVGDYVIAIGNPFGLEQTATFGIVSALGRSGLGIEGYENFIQTDASINPGNSGGALVNLRGELVGINAAIVGPSGGNVGIGFAIPINMARNVAEQLIAHGKISRGQLGVRVQDLTPELAKALKVQTQEGAVIASVVPGSAAAHAGLKAGDVVASVNGTIVHNAAALRNMIGLLPVGSSVDLAFIRNGTTKTAAITLAEVHTQKVEVPAGVTPLAGVVLGATEGGTPGSDEQGVLVTSVKKGSAAAQAGLRSGDIITTVNQHSVASPNDVVDLARQADGQVLLQVMRNGAPMFIVIG